MVISISGPFAALHPAGHTYVCSRCTTSDNFTHQCCHLVVVLRYIEFKMCNRAALQTFMVSPIVNMW